MEKSIEFNLSSKDRKEIRYEIVNLFLNEEPGTGKQELSSKYIYYVETLLDGKRIFLKRPANLNKGFDFIIKVEDIEFREKGADKDAPRHSDIITDLKNKRNEDEDKYNELYSLIKDIYECKDINSSDMEKLSFKNGYSVELVLKLIKWFFIEQDITYWNYSGRAMLMDNINNIGGE
ncbi:DNA adenine methylase [Clostridium perfringens]